MTVRPSLAGLRSSNFQIFFYTEPNRNTKVQKLGRTLAGVRVGGVESGQSGAKSKKG
jgi:hypothetical protein